MEKLLTETECAEWLNIQVSYLRRDRVTKNVAAGTCVIPFIRVGSTMIRYSPNAVQCWLDNAAAAAMVAPQPKPKATAAAPKLSPDGQPARSRGRPPGSTKAKKLAQLAAAEIGEAQNG